MLTIDADSMKVTRVNRATLELVGLPREELLGRPCRQCYCQANHDECPAAAPNFTGFQDEQELRCFHGRRVPVLRSVIPIVLNGRRHLLECFTDISKLKQAAEEQRAQLQFLQSLLDTIPNPIFYKDRAGVYRGCNKAFAKWIGKVSLEDHRNHY